MRPVWSQCLGAGLLFRPALFISVKAWNPKPQRTRSFRKHSRASGRSKGSRSQSRHCPLVSGRAFSPSSERSLLSGSFGFRCRCRNRGRLLRRRFLGRGLFCGGWFRFRSMGFLRSFWFGRCWFGLASNLRPSASLRCFHLAPSRSGEFPALALGGFRRSGGLCGTTGKHRTEFGNLSIDAGSLRFAALDGGGDDFWVELLCRHVSLSQFRR